MSVHVRLDEMLKARGWSMYKLAEVSGVSQNNIWRLVRRKTTQVTFPTLSRICAALDCQIGDFLIYEADQPGLPLAMAPENDNLPVKPTHDVDMSQA